MLNKLKNLLGIKTRLDKAKAAVDGAAAQPSVTAMKAIQDWLEHSLPGMVAKKDSLETLRLIDPQLRAILEGIMASMVEAQFNHTRLSLLLGHATPYCSLIVNTYADAIRREAQAMSKNSANAPLIQACITNWLYWIGRDHVIRFVKQPRTDELPWNEIRPITDFALKLDGGLASKIGKADGEAGRLQKQLSHLVLLSRTFTEDMRGRQILVADRIADALSGFIKVSDSHSEQTPFGQNTQGNSPPTMLTQSAATNKGLFYGLDKSLLELAALENLISTQNKVPSKVDPYGMLDVAETLAVIRYLRNRWSGRVVKREADRKAVTGKLKIAHDFNVLRQMISLVGAQNTSSLKGIYLTVEDCEVGDVSATGVGVKISSRKGWAKIGLLVGLKTERDVNWRIGVIRRVQPVKHDETDVGVQFLSRDPESVRATVRANVSDWEKTTEVQSYDNKLALYLRPDELNSNNHLLICGKAELKIGGKYTLPGTRDGDLAMRVTDQQELGPDSIIYRCERLSVTRTSSDSDAGISI